MTHEPTNEKTNGASTSAIPYVAPFFAFVLLTALEKYAGPYPIAYGIKILLVTITLAVCSRHWRHEIRRDSRGVSLGWVIGLVGLPLWLGLHAVTPPLPAWLGGGRASFDPFRDIPDPVWRLVFLAERFFGLVVVVPLLEEVFWRSFLLRYITDPDRWATRPLSEFSPVAFFAVAFLFAGVHPEYLAAFVYAALLAGLLRFSGGSLSACIIAHAVTNLSLGVYVLLTRNFQYW
ncbi:MAG: CAAX prenyl protease-related protein [Capsulimonadales bacterium]|nr:CAAX prenyl protease-related protein [Capsulimonadales bacterium]